MKHIKLAPINQSKLARTTWQTFFAKKNLDFFQEKRFNKSRLVFLTVWDTPTYDPKIMNKRIRRIARLVKGYTHRNWMCARGFTEVEPISTGQYHPHAHIVIECSENEQKLMRKYLVAKGYNNPYAIRFDEVTELCLKFFAYPLKGQSTYRDAFGNYTKERLSQTHQTELKRYGQPIEIAVGDAAKTVKPDNRKWKIVHQQINDFITVPVKVYDDGLETMDNIVNDHLTMALHSTSQGFDNTTTSPSKLNTTSPSKQSLSAEADKPSIPPPRQN